jgi:DNA-directed RNA polymerase specialized sigma subunit
MDMTEAKIERLARRAAQGTPLTEGDKDALMDLLEPELRGFAHRDPDGSRTQRMRRAAWKAVGRYDPGRGPFLPFLRRTLGQRRMERDAEDSPGPRRRSLAHRIRDHHATHDPCRCSASELAEQLGVSEEQVARALPFAERPVSIDEPLSNEDARTQGDRVASPDADILEAVAAAVSAAEVLRLCRAALPDRLLRQVFGLRLARRGGPPGQLPLTLAQAAAELGTHPLHVWLRERQVQRILEPLFQAHLGCDPGGAEEDAPV